MVRVAPALIQPIEDKCSALKEPDTSIRSVANFHREQGQMKVVLASSSQVTRRSSSPEDGKELISAATMSTEESSQRSSSLSSGECAKLVSAATTAPVASNIHQSLVGASVVGSASSSPGEATEQTQKQTSALPEHDQLVMVGETDRNLSNISFGEAFSGGGSGEPTIEGTMITSEEQEFGFLDEDAASDVAPSPGVSKQLSKSRLSKGLLDTPPKTTAPQQSPAIGDVFRLPPALSSGSGTSSSQVAATPVAAASSLLTVESAVGSSVSSSFSTNTPQTRVLYSAIGSLEDPSGSFQKKWKKTAASTAKGTAMTTTTALGPRILPGPFLIPGAHLMPQPPSAQGVRSRAVADGVPSTENKRQSSLSAKMTALEEQKSPGSSGDAAPSTTRAAAAATTKAAVATGGPATAKSRTTTAANTGSGATADTTPPTSNHEATTAATAQTTAGALKSSLRPSGSVLKKKTSASERLPPKRVTIDPAAPKRKSSSGTRANRRRSASERSAKKPVEMFRPSSDAYTPRMGKKDLKYKPAAMRTPVQHMATPLGTISRPNFRDALRRVAMIIHQHIVKIERRFEEKKIVRHSDGLFSEDMKNAFREESFVTPKYKCSMVRVPMARPGMVFGLKRQHQVYEIPSEGEIFEFAERLFNAVQLSSECSIVCLIYMERLMEQGKVPLLACTWRPIFMCGLLLASKVWQDLSSWNIEFASVYPQYSLDAINRLEIQFLRMVKWDLYISSSLYAKYYFALRSLVEKPDFRNRYNRMVAGVNNVQASQARKVEERSTQFKEEVLMQLSRSM